MEIDKSDFLDDFIEDMNELMEQAQISLQKLNSSPSQDVLNELFRVAHSIKGMSASMEFKRMEMLTHKIEDLMFVVRDNTIKFNNDILEVLEIGFAFLNELFTSVKLSGVEDDAPCEGMDVLLVDIKNLLNDKKSTYESEEINKIEKNLFEHKKIEVVENLVEIEIVFDDSSPFKSVRAFMALNKIKSYCNLLRVIPSEASINSKDYEMQTNILYVFVDLTAEHFNTLKDELANMMEVLSVSINFVKDLNDISIKNNEKDYLENYKNIIKIIGQIELKIVKLEYLDSKELNLSSILDDLNILLQLTNNIQLEEIKQLSIKLFEFINLVSNKNLRDDGQRVETILDCLILIKDTISNKNEENLEKVIKKIDKNIKILTCFIEEEKISSNQPLGNILIDKGILKEEDIEEILSMQKDQFPQKKFGEIALEQHKVSSKDLISALKIQGKKVENKSEETVELLKVPVVKADKLIDLLEELIMVQSQLEKNIINDFTKDSLTVKTMLTSFRITKEIQNLSISFRMVSLRNIFQKVNITIRDSLKKLDKQANVLIFGEDTQIDRVVGNKIIDPLLHLVKNSVAHGIENREDRLKSGKKESGIISISARSEKGHVYIEITDDGQGINPEKILKTAIKKGIVTDASLLSEEDIINLVFAPGFSTAEVIDTISGRGVGMDVVKTEISKLGGRISINNKIGQGITFTLRIPQNMTSLNGTVVNIKNKRYIIPTQFIKEIFSVNEDSYVSVLGENKYIKLRKEIIPIIPIKNHFSANDEVNIMVVLNVDGEQKALPVNQIMERREIVVKPLGDDFDNIKYISGASILGDGEAALILAVEQLFKLK